MRLGRRRMILLKHFMQIQNRNLHLYVKAKVAFIATIIWRIIGTKCHYASDTMGIQFRFLIHCYLSLHELFQ